MRSSIQQEQQAFGDDLWCLSGLPGGEDFSIDEFFDLPDNNHDKDGCSNSLSESQDPLADSDSSFPDFSPALPIPVDDMQQLELWSHFMDDAVPEANFVSPNSHHTITNTQDKKKTGYPVNRVKPVRKSGLSRVLLIPSVIPCKPRSKRSRTARNGSWFESSLSSSSSSSPVSTLLYPPPVQDMGMILTFGKRSQKKRPGPVDGDTGTGTGDPPFQRQCSHCQATKTPQWRAGPTGPKTLCNACGVRYKSGRLFPEYRPACSPTFSSEMHSNSHRKVLEMRRKKEMSESVTGSTPTAPVVR